MAARDERVRDLMTRAPKTLRRNDRVTSADELIRMERIRHLPVLDDDGEAVVGVVSQRDLFRGALARALGWGEHAQTRLFGQLFIKDVMTNEPVTIAPDAPLRDAAALMLARQIGCLPVVEDGRLVGILTESDFVRRHAAG
jgi:CBS domain-containing protein